MSAMAEIIRVKIEDGKTGLFFATSPDLQGLLVGKPTLDELFEAIPQAIVDLFAVGRGVAVKVILAKRLTQFEHPFVAVPTT
jgi:hypothetical protein